MKRRKYKLYQLLTFNICMNYVRDPIITNRIKLVDCLKRWASADIKVEAYDYSQGNIWERLEYCADRMSSGRAKALLKLLEGA